MIQDLKGKKYETVICNAAGIAAAAKHTMMYSW